MSNGMKGYKGFYPGLVCEPDDGPKKQYAENTIYEEDKAEPCKRGMHFCKYPLEAFRYYPPVTNKGVSEYAEVEAMDEPVTDDGNKYCSKKLKIGAKIGIPALIQASGVSFYNKRKKQLAKKKSAKELEAEKKKKELAKKSEILYQLRQDFIKDLSTRKNIKGIDTNSLEALKKCVTSGIGIYGSESEKIAKIYEIDFRYRQEDYEALRKCSADYPDGFKAVMAYYWISGDNKSLTLYNSTGTSSGERLKIIYDYLIALGYEPCDEEKLFI